VRSTHVLAEARRQHEVIASATDPKEDLMAIAAVFEFPGQPVEKYHKVFEAGDAIVDQPKRLHHVCYRTGEGFTVIDIWADEQSFAAFGETLGPAVQQAGLDARPAVYPVEQLITQDGTTTA
jgi:hypothetical protein